MHTDTPSLPNPFRDKAWPPALRPDAEALWQFHLALFHSASNGKVGTMSPGSFQEEANRLKSGNNISLIDPSVTEQALDVCRKHKLELDEPANQVEAAGVFHQKEVRFETYKDLKTFMRKWAGAHGLLLAGLADVRYSWQIPMVEEVSRAFFLTGRLAELPADMKRNRLFIPLEELETAGVSIDRLKEGVVDENMKRMLWRQIIRARDSLARGEELPHDLSGKLKSEYKRWWFGCLEILNEIERRKYDIWTRPIVLATRQRIQVRFQARFGRTTFRSK